MNTDNGYMIPIEGAGDSIVASVLSKYVSRADIGQKKYGVTLDRNDLSFIDWLKHLQEELMDATLYVEKLKNELESSNSFPDGHVITKESWDNADKIVHDGFVYVKYTDLLFYK